jgi:phage-related protein
LQPVFGLIGTVLTEVVFPILQKVFEVLGFIAEAISPLVDAAIPALKAAFEGLKAIVESIVGFFQKVVDGLTSIGDKAKELKDGVVGTFDNMKDSVTGAVSDMTEKTKGFFSDMYQKVVGGSIVPDMVNEVIAEFQRMNQGVVTTTVETTTTVTKEFEKVGDAIQNDFLSAMQGAFDDGKLSLSDFEGFFKQSLTRILTEALTSGSSISNALGGIFSGGFGGGGGGFGSIFSSIGSFFGGFFADGGRLGANKFGIAGENGAEIITGPANITPMDQLPTGPNVTINLNTIDSRSGTEFLLENKANIENIIQRAFNRRGKEGMA